MKQEMISPRQTGFLAYAGAAGNIVYDFTYVANITGRAVWVAVLLGMGLVIPFAFWMLKISKEYPECSAFDMIQKGMGKIVGKCFLILYIILTIALCVCMLNLITGSVDLYFLPKTPSFVILLFLIIMCTTFAQSGIKIVSYLIEALVILYSVTFFFGFSFSFVRVFNLEYIIPVFDTSALNLLKGVLIIAGLGMETVMFWLVVVKNTDGSYKNGIAAVKGIVTVSIVMTAAVLLMQGCFSTELLARAAHSGITVSRIIQVRNYIRGVEVFLLITYQMIAVAKCTMHMYILKEAMKELFSRKEGRVLSVISSLIVLILSMLFNSYNFAYYFSLVLGVYVIIPFVLVILMLVFLSRWIQKNRRKHSKMGERIL